MGSAWRKNDDLSYSESGGKSAAGDWEIPGQWSPVCEVVWSFHGVGVQIPTARLSNTHSPTGDLSPTANQVVRVSCIRSVENKQLLFHRLKYAT